MEKTFMPKNILVTGANGQLGSEIQQLIAQYTQYLFFVTDKEQLDITNKKAIEQYCENKEIAVIINCAAYTAVDKAETEKELANKINHLAVKNLAEVAKQNQMALIHISTDYVFNGQNYRPYIETDKTDPQSTYGITKHQGEQAVLEINPENSIIIRTSWIYSAFGNNFVKTMLRLGKQKQELSVIFDQIGTPTHAKDLAQAILSIIPQLNNKQVETYHYSNEGVCSWYDFTKAIFEHEQISCKVNPIETKDYPTPATRPHYSLLNKTKIKQRYGLKIPYWKDSLNECLNAIEIVRRKT